MPMEKLRLPDPVEPEECTPGEGLTPRLPGPRWPAPVLPNMRAGDSFLAPGDSPRLIVVDVFGDGSRDPGLKRGSGVVLRLEDGPDKESRILFAGPRPRFKK